jgi:FkbM family methyltransferase
MSSALVKSMALKAVALGVKIPEPRIDRVIELIHLKRLLSILDVNCVVDVGANRGQFAKELRAIGYAGRIVSFEPIRLEFDRMSRHFSDDAHWKGYRLALGNEERETNIHVARLTVLSSLLNSISQEEKRREHIEKVSVRRLDTMFASLVEGIDAPRVFLKMDTQGYDLEVFKGAAGCISEICGLQSELSVQPIYEAMPHYLEALAVYEEAGFDLHNLSVVNRGSDGELVELNCFMRRRR